jgi:predicted lipoprotein with Yx(FWY)xxD motif
MVFAKVLRGALLAALAPVGVAACGGSEESGGPPPAAATASPTPAARPAASNGRTTVRVARSRVGPILVDARGRTLYFFTQDKPRRALCTSDYLNCTTSWMPLMTTARPRGPAGVDTRLLGTFRRSRPAGSQVTYNGRPLYRYIEDERAGDLKGQGLYSYWYVLAPNGRPIRRKP